MEAKYMVEEVVEPVVELPDPALSPTSKLIHNNQRTESGTLTELQKEIERYEACTYPGTTTKCFQVGSSRIQSTYSF